MKRTLAILMVLVSSAAADNTSKLSMTEGQWELAGDSAMESGSGVHGLKQNGAAQPSKLCLTRKSPVPVDPRSAPEGMKCSTKHTVTGNDVAWTTTCEGKASSVEGKGTVTYADKTMSGSSETVVKIKGGRGMKLSMKLSGKYLGACPK